MNTSLLEEMRTNLTNEELKAEGKRSAVTFKMPETDDRLGKSVSDIAAGIFVEIYNYRHRNRK